MTEDSEQGYVTPARFLEDFFGGARALEADSVEAALARASEEGILDKVAAYIRYRRPDLGETIDRHLPGSGEES